jgi:hypothetical protein
LRRSPSGVLSDRHRFAGERRFFDPQVDALHQAQVGRDVIAGFQHHQVARHQLAGRDRDLVAAADDFGLRRGQLFERGQRLLRLALLHHADDGVEDDDGQDGPAVQPLAQGKRDQRRDDENDDQELFELVQQQTPEGGAFPLDELIGAVSFQSRGGFGDRQSALLVGIQCLYHLLRRKTVPRRVICFHG